MPDAMVRLIESKRMEKFHSLVLNGAAQSTLSEPTLVPESRSGYTAIVTHPRISRQMK